MKKEKHAKGWKPFEHEPIFKKAKHKALDKKKETFVGYMGIKKREGKRLDREYAADKYRHS